jgi:DtxR family Mn-dependent transcriptional regulator
LEKTENLCAVMHKSDSQSSRSMQDYLKAIAALSSIDEHVTTTQISRRLSIASPSVTSMLKKLTEKGYTSYRAYYGITLTAKGVKESQKITRKHMLLEKLFADVLHIKKDHINPQACIMEHALSDDAEAALCRFLHHPDKCPDGNIIPACDLPFSTCEECIAAHRKGSQEVKRRQQNLQAISKLKAEDTAKVSFIRAESPVLETIFSMGLTLGTQINIVSNTGQAVEVNVGKSNVLLGQDVAAKVFVELTQTT